ncbi:unnamed protein product [Auanema sp. JU1783]|nr:unnamed protein product [Auanema sp. JU1783]
MLVRACITSCSLLRLKSLHGVASSTGRFFSQKLVPLASINKDDLGNRVLLCKETLPPGAEKTPHDVLSTAVFGAKVLSLSSSVVGAVMVPVLSNYMWEAAAQRPTMMMFTLVANSFLVLLSFTPLLLHFLAKRFPVELYYNHETKTFTSVHYDFFLRKKARRFHSSDVVDAQKAPELKKVWIPLATAFVHHQPLLISLDKSNYVDQIAFDELTKNIEIPKNHD